MDKNPNISARTHKKKGLRYQIMQLGSHFLLTIIVEGFQRRNICVLTSKDLLSVQAILKPSDKSTRRINVLADATQGEQGYSYEQQFNLPDDYRATQAHLSNDLLQILISPAKGEAPLIEKLAISQGRESIRFSQN